jgi:hypothetical protein
MICLRYNFDSPESFFRHLRLGNGLFVPIRPLRGTRVGVEAGWPDCMDSLLLHGRVRERTRDGAWLDLPPTWIPGPLAQSRCVRRVPCDLFTEVRPLGGSPYLSRVLDLSSRGIRLQAGWLEAGIAGDEVSLTLLSPEPIELRARLAWSGVRDAGLEFLDPPAVLSGLVATLDTHWQELNHSADCRCGHAVLRVGG